MIYQKVKGVIVSVIILCFITLSGCQIESDHVSPAYHVAFDNYALRTYIDLYETKLLYMETGETDTAFYIYNFQDGSNKKILTVGNFALKGMSNAFIDDDLYFYMSLYQGSELENDLYVVNFSEERMYTESKNTYYQKLIPLTVLDDKLISLQGDYSENGTFQSFIEMQDSSHTMERAQMHNAASQPRRIISIASDNTYLYAIEISDSDPDKKCFIVKYDLNYSSISETEITQILKKYEITSGIASFSVFQNYFTITDYSSNTIVCSFAGGDNQALLCENDLVCVPNDTVGSSHEFLYKRNTNEIYRLDTESGKFEIQNFDLENDTYSIRVMLSYEDNLLIVKQPDNGNGKENVYLIPQKYEKQ